MNTKELEQFKSLLRDLVEVKKRLESDLHEAFAISDQIKNLLVENAYESRIVSNEQRFFSDIRNRISNFTIVRQLERRLHQFERETRLEEETKEVITKRTQEVDSKLERIRRFLQEVDKK